MWVLTNQGWLSAVKHRTKENCLILRARNLQALSDHFPISEIKYTPKADYFWRTEISPEQFLQVLQVEVGCIDYPNFKNSVKDVNLSDAYHDTWYLGFEYQQLKLKNDLKSYRENLRLNGLLKKKKRKKKRKSS
jgi:hypothetical protein